MTPRIALALACAALLGSGCYCSHPLQPDAGPDAGAVDAGATDAGRDSQVRVRGCEDPRVWSALAEEAELWARLGGGACSPAQYPLHSTLLRWLAGRHVMPEEGARLARSCWRVVEAHPSSGWAVGDVFSSDPEFGHAVIRGFERPVTFEGRVLRDDGTIAFAVQPGAVALDPAQVVLGDASAVAAVMTRDAWAESDALHLEGERVSTDPVVAATATLSGGPVTLHRGAEGLTLRFWSRVPGGELSSQDLSLPTDGERVLLASGGRAVAIDDELLIVGSEDGAAIVRHRIALPAPPLELVGRYYYVVVHVPGALIHYDYTSGAPRTLDVGPGRLLPSKNDRSPHYFDGETFVGLDFPDGSLAFDERTRVRPSPAHLEALGEPFAVMHGVVLGEGGFLIAVDEASETPVGPRFASIADLFGDGRLAMVGADGVTYLIERADGTKTLYTAPYNSYCE